MRQSTRLSTALAVAGLSVVLNLSCTQSLEQERLNHYLEAIAAEEAAVPGGASISTAGSTITGTTILGGTPRLASPGVCGDGIINGLGEDCDKGAITNPNCSELGGISGTVKCSENCLYDLSDCITPAVNERIGGTTENCKCNCAGNRCNGGCNPSNGASVGQTRCRYDCDNDCICKCEGKMEAHIESCEFTCLCSLDTAGNPICDCTMDTCDVLTIISPNIANLTDKSASGGH